jgi:hypothetical protein
VPILKSEVALSPPDLFDLPDLPWRVAYVRSRQEKELARLLLRLGVPFYLRRAPGSGSGRGDAAVRGTLAGLTAGDLTAGGPGGRRTAIGLDGGRA